MARSPWNDIPSRSGLERYHNGFDAMPALAVADIWSADAGEAKMAGIKVLFRYQKVQWQLPVEAYRDTFLKWELEGELGKEAVASLYRRALYVLDQMAAARIEAMRSGANQADRNRRPDPDTHSPLAIVMAALLDEIELTRGQAGITKNAIFEAVAGQAARSTGPWMKYGQPTGQAATGPWTKYAQGAAPQPASPAGNQRQPNVFDQFDEPAAPAAPKGNFFDRFDEPAAPAAPAGNIFDQFDEPARAQPTGGNFFDRFDPPAGAAALDPARSSGAQFAPMPPATAPVDAATGRALPMPITPPAYHDGSVAPTTAATQTAAAPAEEDPVDSWLLDVAASGAKGIRDGLTAIPDAAIHAVNNAPRLLNAPKMIPGMEDAYGEVGTITDFGAALDNWMSGGDFAVPEGTRTAPVTLQDVTNGFGALDYQPQTGAGRFADRVGNEIGASLLPAGAAMRFGDKFVGNPAAHEGVRRLVEPFVRKPRAALGRELAGATAAGTGAATANAVHDAATGGEDGTWWTDLLGGLGGLGAAGVAEWAVRGGVNAIATSATRPATSRRSRARPWRIG